jgi:hypothetical protein
MSVQLDTRGLDRLLNGLLDRALDAGADAGADKTVELAKANVVVGPDAPHTRDTIRKVSAGQVYEVQAEEAAIFIELGSSKMPARPFLLPAATDEATFQAIAEAVKEAIDGL